MGNLKLKKYFYIWDKLYTDEDNAKRRSTVLKISRSLGKTKITLFKNAYHKYNFYVLHLCLETTVFQMIMSQSLAIAF